RYGGADSPSAARGGAARATGAPPPPPAPRWGGGGVKRTGPGPTHRPPRPPRPTPAPPPYIAGRGAVRPPALRVAHGRRTPPPPPTSPGVWPGCWTASGPGNWDDPSATPVSPGRRAVRWGCGPAGCRAGLAVALGWLSGPAGWASLFAAAGVECGNRLAHLL